MTQTIHVAVGVIFNKTGEILIALRDKHRHQGGLWEFPGGKVDEGENVSQALSRELHEEIGIQVVRSHPLVQISHSYPDKSVLLDVWCVDEFSGLPSGKEGQEICWIDPASMNPADFPLANRRIIHILQLPDRIAITGSAPDKDSFINALEGVLDQGIHLIQFRPTRLDGRSLANSCLLDWWESALLECRARGSKLIPNCPMEILHDLEGDGFHANSRTLMSLESRPIASDLLFSASCHSLAQLQKAQLLEVDFAFLSPVQPTGSHPEAKILGWEKFADLVSQVNIPVYALGGLDCDDIARARSHGARGIAAISAFWI